VVQAVHPEVVLVGAGALAALAAILGLSLPVLNRWEPVPVDTPGEPRSVTAAGSPNGATPVGATRVGATPVGAMPNGATPDVAGAGASQGARRGAPADTSSQP
jgi:hypothetical protein